MFEDGKRLYLLRYYFVLTFEKIISLKKPKSSCWRSLLSLSRNVCHRVHVPKEGTSHFLLRGGQREESFKKNPFQVECKSIPDYGGGTPGKNGAVAGIL